MEALPSQVSVSEESFLDPITGEIVVRKQFANHQLAKVILKSYIFFHLLILGYFGYLGINVFISSNSR